MIQMTFIHTPTPLNSKSMAKNVSVCYKQQKSFFFYSPKYHTGFEMTFKKSSFPSTRKELSWSNFWCPYSRIEWKHPKEEFSIIILNRTHYHFVLVNWKFFKELQWSQLLHIVNIFYKFLCLLMSERANHHKARTKKGNKWNISWYWLQ